jgi:replicative DNA helicase
MADVNGQTFRSSERVDDIPEPTEPPKPADPIDQHVNELKQRTFTAKGDELLTRLELRAEGTDKPIKTPWTCLDDAVGGGLWPGLHFVVGSTGAGKTQFAMQIAIEAAKAKVPIPVLYIALELGELDLFARAAGILRPEAGKWSEFFLGKDIDDKPVRVPNSVLDELKKLPFHWIVAPTSGWNHSGLSPNVEAMRKIYPEATTILVVIDFAQLLDGDQRELREKIGKAAYAARGVARDQNATVLMLSSTSRENYQFTEAGQKGENVKSKKPVWEGPPAILVGLGKESGETEYASDSVMVLVKEPWPEGATEPPPGGTRFHLAIAKLRAGQPSWVNLRFNGSLFTSVPTGPKLEQANNSDLKY